MVGILAATRQRLFFGWLTNSMPWNYSHTHMTYTTHFVPNSSSRSREEIDLNSRHMTHDWFPEPLPENVFLGERCWLYSSFAFRHYRSCRPRGVDVKHDTGIYNGTFFDLGPRGEVSIGSFCTLVGAIICCNTRVVIR